MTQISIPGAARAARRRSSRRPAALAAIPLAILLSPGPAQADDAATETWQVHGQSTYVWQRKPAMAAAYSGANSLSTARETSYSFTATAALGWRPAPDTELYFDAEAAQGVPLSGLTGLGGFTNGEMARTSGPTLTFYRARLFARQTWNLGEATEPVESDFNQLAGQISRRRVVLTVGNLSVTDIFDDNSYSHDPRTQFLNWSIMTMGAFDFAADARGYTVGAALQWFHDDWTLRLGRFALPKEPNQQALDWQLGRRFGDQIELQHDHRIANQPGKLRVLVFHDRTVMARFDDALALARQTAGTPDINRVRNKLQDKWGWGIGLEQALGPNLGLFARYSQADGQTETDAFTEIDRSLSGGLLLDGQAWQRPGDRWGIAFASNRLSPSRRNYLAAGGLGFFIGDGALNYRPEQVLETFYSLQLQPRLSVTIDGQVIAHPAYNADRGPAKVLGLRAHLAF